MNYKIVGYILGHVIRIEGLLMLLPCLVALIYQEKAGFVYAGVSMLLILLGTLIAQFKPKNSVFHIKEGAAITGLSWIILSVCGAIPFMVTGEIPSFVDAVFETSSGFTTTGATILSDVEALSHASLFWRSFTHWIGGMGVLVFLLAIIPLSGGSRINLMKAESPGPQVGKLVPKIKDTAKVLYTIYFVMTIIQIVILLLSKMPVFDAITITFGTAGTGGFSVRNDSVASYTNFQIWVITVFMFLFGMNFNFFFFISLGKFKKAFAIEEVKWYLAIYLMGVFFCVIGNKDIIETFSDNLRHSAFQVSSIMSTTGYSTVDFNMWSPSAKSVLLLSMFIGACAGSTGGGFKVSRLMILIKSAHKELKSYLNPKSINNVQMEGKTLDKDLIYSVLVYLALYVIICISSCMLLSIENQDLVTNFSAVLATFNNIGPGLESVGPVTNYGSLTDFSKCVLIFDMIAGRLELFPMLVLFMPSLWTGFIKRKSAT